MKKYFGTDGIRDVAGSNLTPELAFKVAKAGASVLASVSGEKPLILIGRDTRISGQLIESAMVAGFLSVGANVKLLGVLPTPAVAYLTTKLRASASVVISASHNSFEFNGIKFFGSNGMKISDEIEEQIESLMDSEDLNLKNAVNENVGRLEYAFDDHEMYVDYLVSIFEGKFNFDNEFKVVIDASNGAAYSIAEKVYEKLGINFDIISNNPDGININENCGSTHMDDLKKYVTDKNCNIGIAYDGDTDRCLAVDNTGEIIDGDKLLAIIGSMFKKQGKLNNDTIVATVMSNIGFSKYAKESNIDLKQTKVGDRYVLEEMLKNNFNLGGEQSGHVIMLDYNPTGDGILTSLMLLLALSESGKSSKELNDVFKVYPQVLVNVRINNEFKKVYADNEVIKNKLVELDNKYDGSGRVLLRASGTEPLIRVMIEGEDLNVITEDANLFAEVIDVEAKKYVA